MSPHEILGLALVMFAGHAAGYARAVDAMCRRRRRATHRRVGRPE